MDLPRFKASDDCMSYEQLLHYTNFDVLKLMLINRTLKSNSLKHVNDRLERQRKGIEDMTDAFYVSCFCHNQYEIVPFWFMYGGSALDCNKILLRFKNFAGNFENAIESDWAFTSENKIIYFDQKNLFAVNTGNVYCCPIDDPLVESRQTIKNVRLFDVEYLLPNDGAFSKEYKTQGNVSFVESHSSIPAAISDLRLVGKQKKINWKYEDETRIQCILDPIGSYFFDFILLRLKDELFRDLVIVANPWASDSFIADISKTLHESTLPKDIKNTIIIQRSELDGQIVGKDFI